MNRDVRAALAAETVKIAEAGEYCSADGRRVDISESVQTCLDATRCQTPEDLNEIRSRVLAGERPFARTGFEVANETTLRGASRLVGQSDERVGVLNFASAKNPGGGFLGGSQAQEESLARSSALYASLLKCPEYYEVHRRQHSLLYSDRMIHSPGCPVFRDDAGTLLSTPYVVDVMTSAAPNAGAIRRNEPGSVERIAPVFRQRIAKVLALAVHAGIGRMVLGAWGCGVFRNDPVFVARAFGEALKEGGPFCGRFRLVTFSVLDTSAGRETFAAFADEFGGAG